MVSLPKELTQTEITFLHSLAVSVAATEGEYMRPYPMAWERPMEATQGQRPESKDQ